MQELPQDPGECQCGYCQERRAEAVASREASVLGHLDKMAQHAREAAEAGNAIAFGATDQPKPPIHLDHGEVKFWEATFVACLGEALFGAEAITNAARGLANGAAELADEAVRLRRERLS